MIHKKQTKLISLNLFKNLINKDCFILNNKSVSNNDICNISEANINLKSISGISNDIYKVDLILNTEANNEYKIPVISLLFRWFGKISNLVDRQLETKIMIGLNNANLGPSILETDNKTYRVEEYIYNSRNVLNNELLDLSTINQIFNILMNFYKIDDNQKYISISNISNNQSTKYVKNNCNSNSYNHISSISTKSKISSNSNDELEHVNLHKKVDYNSVYKYLVYDYLIKEKESNIFNFAIRLKKMAEISLETFKNNYLKDKNVSNLSEEFTLELDLKLKKIDTILAESMEGILDTVPDFPIIVLSHNDIHPGNLIINDNNKIFLIDHEYSCYNYLGFDIANFLLESIFTLSWNEFPYYKQFENYDILRSNRYYDIYYNFINKYFDAYSNLLKSNSINIENAKKEYLNRKTLYNLIGTCSIYWTLYAIFYIDYNNYKKKSDFDYLNYSILRYYAYEFLAKKY